MMKYLLTALLLFPYAFTQAQSPKQKLSKDSIRYYRNELNELHKATYDSMVTSNRYKEIAKKLNLDEKNTKSKFGMEILGYVGVQLNDFTNINERLKALNITQLKSFMASVGFGMSFRINKIIVGYDLSLVMTGGDHNKTQTSGYYIHGYLSTNVIKTKNWIFSPQIGIAEQGISARVVTPSTATDFNSYFTSSSNQVEIRNKNTVLDFALAFKLRNEKAENYVPLFRLGYRYGLNSEMWEVKNASVTDGPVDRINNFYFQILLGIGD